MAVPEAVMAAVRRAPSPLLLAWSTGKAESGGARSPGLAGALLWEAPTCHLCFFSKLFLGVPRVLALSVLGHSNFCTT